MVIVEDRTHSEHIPSRDVGTDLLQVDSWRLWYAHPPPRPTDVRFTISNLTVRALRGWCAATYFPSADLQQLCDLYHGEGGMELPRELVDEIMQYHDLHTLKNCSLTSRALYSATRPLIHRRMALGVGSAVRGSHLERLPLDLDQAELFHARYLSAAEDRGLLRYGYIREVRLNLSIGNPENVLRLRQLLALETVHTLEIEMLDLHKILPIFGRCFAQFVPTLRSLSLKTTYCENAHQLMEFVCRFPSLDNLELMNPCGLGHAAFVGAPPGTEGPRPQHPLPFGGHLVLNGMGPLAQCLLDLPGGIRFRSIDASSYLRDLAKLLVACSSTLEVLSIRCFDSRMSSTLILTRRSTEGSPASFPLRSKASRSSCRPWAWEDAQCRPGAQRKVQTVRT